MKKELIILVGNIGAGKSTLAKEYQKDGYIIIARDQLRYAIGGGVYIFDYEYESIIWKTEIQMFRKFIELGVNVVVDEVGLTKDMRKRYILYAKRYNYKIIAIEFSRLSMKKSVNRRMKNPHQQDDRELWESVWKKFDRIYEPPKKLEGIDKIIKL